MAFLIRGVIAVVIALALGVGSATWAVSRLTLGAGITNGAWRTNVLIGSEALDMYARAGIAVAGLFALQRSEAVYFTAMADSTGDPFDGACIYRVEGQDLPARWWSITAYGEDHFLIPNAEKRYSVTRADLLGSAPDGGDAAFSFRVAREPMGPTGLPIGAAERFSLTLRLYGMPPALTDTDNLEADLKGLSLPVITRERCS
ncbi:MAG: DUF1214 domain-containing protein [Alphaproteobacteria bacterium]